ncbi:helix-turn-helix domain-containing protein [Streptomyces atratus]|uniref:helix-turn-helix domain-containing protein n=1 Tax=Streptomyces atratus TaxID=1893 RepID=UPI0033E5AB21
MARSPAPLLVRLPRRPLLVRVGISPLASRLRIHDCRLRSVRPHWKDTPMDLRFEGLEIGIAMESKAVIRIRRTPPPELGPMLRKARERAGTGLRELARQAGVDPGYLAHLEAGRRCPSCTVAHRFAELLPLGEDERTQLLAASVDDAGHDHPGRRRT